MEHILGYATLVAGLALGITFIFCACMKKEDTGEEEQPNAILNLKFDSFETADPR